MERLRRAYRGGTYRWTMTAVAAAAGLLGLGYGLRDARDRLSGAGLAAVLGLGVAFLAVAAVTWRRPGFGAALLAVGSAGGLAGLLLSGYRPLLLLLALLLGVALPAGAAVVLLIRPWVLPEQEKRKG